MKFTQIAGINFMGGTFNHPLGACTLITGKNRKGKTRIQRAAQFAIAGFIPGMGRRNGDMLDELGGGKNLSVMGSFGTESIRREVIKDSKSVSLNSIPNGLPQDWAVPAVLISAKEYFDLSANKRINFLFKAMDLSKCEFSVEKLLADIKNIKLKENTEQTEQVIRDICDEIISGDQLRAHSETSLQAWLDELSETLDKKLKDATAAVKRMDGTVKGLIEIGAQSQAAPVTPSVEGDLIQARKDLATAEAEVTRLKNAAAGVDKQQARKTAIETELAKPHKNGKAGKLTQIESLEKTIAAYIASEHTKAEQDYRTHADQVSRQQSELSTNKKQLETLKAESVKVLTQTCCPTCENKGTTWRKRYEKKQAALTKAIEKRIGELEGQISHSTAARDAADKAVNYWVKKRQEANTANLSLPGVRRELSAIEKEESTIANMRTELEGLANIPSAESNEAATKKRDDAQTRVTELEGKNNLLIQERAQVAAQATAVENAKLNIEEKKVTALALEIVMTAKDKLTEQTIKPLLAVANAICQPLLDQPLEYIDGQIGWTIPGTKTFQSPVTFCGAEESIVFAALQVALALQSPIKIVMIDELGTIDDERKIKLVRLMRELVRGGTLDQFIGNDVSDEDYMRTLGADEITDFTFIKL